MMMVEYLIINKPNTERFKQSRDIIHYRLAIDCHKQYRATGFEAFIYFSDKCCRIFYVFNNRCGNNKIKLSFKFISSEIPLQELYSLFFIECYINSTKFYFDS